MAKKTLLEIVQIILNDIDSDEVNAIDDTLEAQQVAMIVKTCYEEMISNRNWPHLKKLMQLESVGDLAKPNYLKIPQIVSEIYSFKYDHSDGTGTESIPEIKYKYPDEFLRITSSRSVTDVDIIPVVDFSGVRMFIHNNLPPKYWTSFDDQYIICDSYDSAVEDSLQATKSLIYASTLPTMTLVDGFVPDLPTEAFSALIAEATSTASLNLKQMANEKAEQKAGRQQRWLSRKAWVAKGGVRYDDYGRKSAK